MTTLRGRIGLALLVFGLVTLLTLGGTLWLALRDLHREALTGSLAELTVPWAGTLRFQLPDDADRPGEGGRLGFVERLREQRSADSGIRAFLDELEEELGQAQVSLIVIQGQSSYVLNPSQGSANALAQVPEIDTPLVRGQVTTGTTEIEGLGEVVYASSPIFANLRGGGDLPLIMLARTDDSAERATADLIGALALAGLVLLVIGVPMAAGLSRSVTNPLRRLSAAAGDVARGAIPQALPMSGPAEVAEASAAFNAMAAEVGATREAQRQLLADIRHDLRTPLTVISGYSEALRDGTATGEVADRAAGAISDEAARLARMLDDLDHLTMPGTPALPLRLQSVAALEVAGAAIKRFLATAESRGQTLAIAEGADEATVTADRVALDRILGNITDNALTHAPSPGGHVTLEVSVAGGSVTLAVRDDGPGIPPAALPRVFDRFYRGDPSRASRGSGLGLAIVRDLAEALGGEAFAENPAGGGARVGVRLPEHPSPVRA